MPKPRPRTIDERTSLTLSLPQWDVDLKHNALLAETGTLEAGIELRLPTTTLDGARRQLEVHRAFIESLRTSLPEGERARVYVEVAPITEALITGYEQAFHSDNPFLRQLTHDKAEHLREQRRQGALVEFRCYVLFTQTRNASPLDQVLKRFRQSYERGQYELAVKKLHTTRMRLFQAFARHGLKPRLMKGQELFALAYRYFNPHDRVHGTPTFVPTQAHFDEKTLKADPGLADRTLRSQLARSSMRRGFGYLRSDRFYTGIISMERLPNGETFTGMANHLLFLPRTYWLIIDLEHNPYHKALKALHGRARRMTAAANDPGDLTDYSDPSNRLGASEADAALMHVIRTGAHFFKIGLSVIVQELDEPHLEDAIEQTKGEMVKMPGVETTRETFGLLEQYLNLSPGSGRLNDRIFQTLEENATAFLPTTTPWEGNKQHPVMVYGNRWGSLTAIDPFDKASANWNGIVVGGSGSGKTFFMQLFANELRGQNADTIIVDRGYGYQHLVDLHGGHTIPLEPGEVSINPFDLPEGDFAPDDHKRSFLLSLIKTMLRTSGGTISGATDTILGAAIDQAYQRATTQKRDEWGQEVTVSTGVHMSDLLEVLLRLEVLGERTATQDDRQQAQRIATVLQGWTGQNPLGRFIDADTNINVDADMIAFETSGLMSNPQLAPVGIMLIAEMVWKRVQADPERHKLVIFDEVWSLLKIPEAAAFIVELYRRFRRYNAAAYTVTQSLTDFMAPEARGILQSTTHFFLMKLRGEDDDVREFFQLNPDAMNAFRGLTNHKGEFSEALAWIQRQDGVEGGIIRIRPHPLEYWAFTTNARDMALRDKTLARNDGDLYLTLAELAKNHPKGVESA